MANAKNIHKLCMNLGRKKFIENFAQAKKKYVNELETICQVEYIKPELKFCLFCLESRELCKLSCSSVRSLPLIILIHFKVS